MYGIDFKGSNAILGPPPGMTEAECQSLHVLKSEDPHGNPVIISCWRLTAEELVLINRTGVVWLGIYGESMPPSYVAAKRPFTIIGKG